MKKISRPPSAKRPDRPPEPPLTKLSVLKRMLAEAGEHTPGDETKKLISDLRNLVRCLFEAHPAADADHPQAEALRRELEAILNAYREQQEAVAKTADERLTTWAERAKISGVL